MIFKDLVDLLKKPLSLYSTLFISEFIGSLVEVKELIPLLIKLLLKKLRYVI